MEGETCRRGQEGKHLMYEKLYLRITVVTAAAVGAAVRKGAEKSICEVKVKQIEISLSHIWNLHTYLHYILMFLS